MSLVLPLPSGTLLIACELGIGRDDEGGGVVHASVYTGEADHVSYSRHDIWSGSLTFAARHPTDRSRDHEADALLRAWCNESTENVLALPLSQIDPDLPSLPDFPEITGATRSGERSVLALASDAAEEGDWTICAGHFPPGKQIGKIARVDGKRVWQPL